MKSIRLNRALLGIATLIVTLNLSALSGASAQMMPELRTNIQVTGDFVRLGDLFRNAGPAADTPVFRSPAPGTSGMVNAQRLAQAAGRHEVIWENPHRVRYIQISRAGTLISEAEINDLLAEQFRTQIAGMTTDQTFDIRFSSDQSPLFVPSNKEPTAKVVELRYNKRSGHFTAVITAPAGDPSAIRNTYTGRAVRVATVPTLVHTMLRDSIISERDVVMRKIPVHRIDSATLRETEELVGKAATRTLRSGQPLSEADIQQPRLVRKNTEITVRYQSPGLTLTVQALALQSGSKGDIINIRNRQSNRTIQAKVIGPDLVAAQSRGTRLIAANN